MGSLPSRGRRESAIQSLEHPSSDGASGNHMYVAVALCNFSPFRSAEQRINIGEKLDIISEEGDMLQVRSTSTNTECLIPRNCVSKVYHRWLFEGITRKKAEELLLLPQNQTGSFLIRESQTCQGSYSLSIRQNSGPLSNIKHYRIYQLSSGWFSVHPSRSFPTLSQLVDYYSGTVGSLCRLKEPCFIRESTTAVGDIPSPIVIDRPNLNWRDVTRSMIQRRPKGTDQETLVSEGLRETMNAYIYITEESRCED